MNVTERLDDVQRQHDWVSIPVAVGKRYGEHNGGRLSAALTYFAFFSVFPLILVFVSVIDLLLESRPELRDDFVDSALGRLPLIGSQITSPDSVSAGGLVPMLIGVGLALWAGLGVMAAMSDAFATIWDVRPSDRPNLVVARLRGLTALVAVALLVAVSTFVGNVSAILGGGVAATILGIGLNVVVNIAGLVGVFYFMTPSSEPWRAHVPGAIVGGVAITVLQQFGSAIAQRYVENASDTYGTVAVVIGLLVWLRFVALVIVLSAEVNVVKARRLHPRSLDDDVVSEADRRAMLLNIERDLNNDQLSTVVKVPESDSVDW